MEQHSDRERPLVPQVHARGTAGRLDAVLDLMSFVARPCPLSTALDELPRRIAQLFPADVCSIYLLEGDELVMRGNVGFPADALGEVRLPVGAGITGLAVEYMRPISLDAATAHVSNRSFPRLEEERFPIFMAVPVCGPRGPLGALVLRRREPPAFSLGEVELAAALTAPIAAVLERSRLMASLRPGPREAKSKPLAARRVTLPGRPVIPGRAVGPVTPFWRAAGTTADEPRTPAATEHVLAQLVASTRRSLGALDQRARERHLDSTFLSTFRVILDDSRLQERVLELAGEGDSLARAFSRAGGEVARAAVRRDDSFALARARSIDELCEALAMLVTSANVEVPRRAVLAGDQVTVFDLLVSARWQPAGIILTSPPSAVGGTLLALLGVPAVVDVSGLFRWVSEGDLALVDGDHGLVRINPGRAEIAGVRAERKSRLGVKVE